MGKPELPYQFTNWEDCREYFSLEALFLGQLCASNPTKHNRRAFKEAAHRAAAADALCSEPLDMEPAGEEGA